MSASANLDLVRSIYADWERGDFARGKASGLEIAAIRGTGSATLLHVRGAKVTKLVLNRDRDYALADLGLAPQADHGESDPRAR